MSPTTSEVGRGRQKAISIQGLLFKNVLGCPIKPWVQRWWAEPQVHSEAACLELPGWPLQHRLGTALPVLWAMYPNIDTFQLVTPCSEKSTAQMCVLQKPFLLFSPLLGVKGELLLDSRKGLPLFSLYGLSKCQAMDHPSSRAGERLRDWPEESSRVLPLTLKPSLL